MIGKKKEIKTKTQIYNSVYVPILTYGAESWPVKSKHTNRIQASEMKFLRRVKGKTRLDQIRNAGIREELEQKPLRNQIGEKQLKWFGHVSRMDPNRKPKQLLEVKPIGRKRRGKPWHTWRDGIIKMGQEEGKSCKFWPRTEGIGEIGSRIRRLKRHKENEKVELCFYLIKLDKFLRTGSSMTTRKLFSCPRNRLLIPMVTKYRIVLSAELSQSSP
jgi:hypothetical protein